MVGGLEAEVEVLLGGMELMAVLQLRWGKEVRWWVGRRVEEAEVVFRREKCLALEKQEVQGLEMKRMLRWRRMLRWKRGEKVD
jgi:hypothetical protein